ncbi:hypothetical protein JCM12178A_32740 [Salidesulfovibrio brasiliensis]
MGAACRGQGEGRSAGSFSMYSNGTRSLDYLLWGIIGFLIIVIFLSGLGTGWLVWG